MKLRIVLGLCLVGLISSLSWGQGYAEENLWKGEVEQYDRAEREPWIKEILRTVKDDILFQMDLQQETQCIGYYSKQSGPDWLMVKGDGKIEGTPRDYHEGYNDFRIQCRPLSSEIYEIKLTIYVDCGG